MINIALRFDDPSITSNHALEKEVIAICSRHGVKINFAVIPYKIIDQEDVPLTSIAAQHLVEGEKRGWLEISQHGYSHQNRAPADKGPSEFKNCAFEEQLNLLSTGKQLLDGIFQRKNRGLVPPWNSFDKMTMVAAKKLDFNFISAGWELPLNDWAPEIKILPRTAQVSNLILDVRKYRVYAALSPVIIAVIHHYDFVESNEKNAKFDLRGFEKIIEHITTNKHVRMTSLESLANNLSPRNTFFAHSTHKFLSNTFNWRLQKHLPTPLFFHNSLKRKP
ncbi:hypothetical protein A9Q88_09250 [Gammaproteobacteria bacterium 50_400_T64]|nr:hypothetical protein A9Q88_09250 [Gammaproteobacteria bacterium 50_400_T64]